MGQDVIEGYQRFRVEFALAERELLAAQRLRYRVFVEEMGANGDLVDHARRLERDAHIPERTRDPAPRPGAR